jgi:hypothetical protein
MMLTTRADNEADEHEPPSYPLVSLTARKCRIQVGHGAGLRAEEPMPVARFELSRRDVLAERSG